MLSDRSDNPAEPDAPVETIHAVLLKIFEVGVLLIGESGIGKSESALDLVSRGHVLIADDAVTLRRADDQVIGESTGLTRDLLEIRGLGIINVKQLFGVSSVEQSCNVELCIKLISSEDREPANRFEGGRSYQELKGQAVKKFELAVSPGRNIALLIETAVRLHRLAREVGDPAEELLERHSRLMDGNQPN